MALGLGKKHKPKKRPVKSAPKWNTAIDSLHQDIETKLKEQGFVFDRMKFMVDDDSWTFGQKVADSVAKFGGSWTFIIVFMFFIACWITANTLLLMNKGWDPYPFILLNLILSCLASLQAPIIMMSQNRQAQKDKKQQELNLEKDIVDFKQDRLDLILDEKQACQLEQMNQRLARIEELLAKK